jgi:hypothetical protein
LKILLKEYCKNFYELEFKDYYSGRTKHEQITSNDCLTQMSKKHEFINLYDLDEFIFPRTMNTSYTSEFNCKDKKSLCSNKPFEYNNNNKSVTSHFYNYLDSLIELYRNGRNRSLLLSISFKHVLYILPNDVEKKLFQDLGFLLDKVNSNSSFPVSIFLGDPPTARGQTYTIEKNDLNYARMIYKSYINLTPCVNNLLVNSSINKMFQRYVYLITEYDQRWPKCIYYYKNVNFVFAHYPTDSKPSSWSITPSEFDGHMLMHFRDEYGSLFNGNFNSSIRRLRIDFEYLFLIVKKFSNYCKI